MKRKIYMLVVACFLLINAETSLSQPVPGDYFKEYIWTTPGGEGNSPFFRVGGKMGYRISPENYPDLEFNGDHVQLKQLVDLNNAIKSEVTAEKVLCHDGTKNLSISVNNNSSLIFPESDKIPEPQEYYMHHFYPTIDLPLNHLKSDSLNYFSLNVDSVQHWNWPQNLIYGVIFRVYYPKPKSVTNVNIKAKQIDEEKIHIALDIDNDDILSIDFVAKYDGPDMDGDGEYNDWHYHYFRGEIKNHVGTSSKKPFQTDWDTSWLPDQEKPISISARINFKSGFTYFAEPIEFEVKRTSSSVELCKPTNQPQKWLTRAGEHSEEIFMVSNPKNITDAKMVFTTWSPGYFNGIYINDFLVFDREGQRYRSMQHDIPINYLEALEQGDNIIKTGKTPKHHGQMVHGVEIMWPGIMLLVRSQKTQVSISEEIYINTAHFKVETTMATWYIEKQSGGCSSLIDSEGRDWISFKKTGDDGPTISSDSDYRGLPNMVYRDPGNGIGHPGFDQCTTEQTSDNELLVRSKNGQWQFKWVFHNDYAEVAIEKADTSRKYWFLYEGPIAGKFSPKTNYWGNNVDGLRTDQPSIFSNPVAGNWQWAFFGDQAVNTTLFVAMPKTDNQPDYFSYMGNSRELGNLSEDGMNVFGFGRGLKTAPMLSGPNHFYVGFFPEKTDNHDAIKELKNHLKKLFRKNK